MTEFIGTHFLTVFGTLCLVIVIAISVLLSKNDKFAQQVSGQASNYYIESVIRLVIVRDTYSDSSNIEHWKNIARAVSNYYGSSWLRIQSTPLDDVLLGVEGSITNTLHSEEDKQRMLESLSNLKRNLKENLPKDVDDSDLYVFPYWLQKQINEAVDAL